MFVYKLLEDIALQFGSPDNEVLKTADWNDDLLDLTADALFKCSEVLREASGKAKEIEEANTIDTSYEALANELESAAAAINELEVNGGEKMEKLASVFDALLLTVCRNQNDIARIKKAKEDELEALRAKFRNEKGEAIYSAHSPANDVPKETVDAVEKAIKPYRPMQHALSSRQSPDMPGVSLMRIADGVYQCPVTKKIYNWEEGFTLNDGAKVPGSTVSNQSEMVRSDVPNHMSFSTRTDKLNKE